MPITVTEDLLRAVVTKDKALSDGRTLARKGSFLNLGATADQSLLWGECQGSGAKPYVLSVDLIGDHPTIRCTCPVKPPPCKHALGLLVLFMEKPTGFTAAQAPAELLEKRSKIVERAEKRVEAAAKPREVNQAALDKKTRVQRDGLDLLETLVLDLVAAGLGSLNVARAERIVEQSRQMTDAYLPGAAEALRRIAALADPRNADGEDEERFYQLEEPGRNLSDDLRYRLMTRHITRLWAMVRKGQKVLDDKLGEGGDPDTEAVVEDLLGQVWDLNGLKARGWWKQGVTLFELADERFRDGVREERIEQGYLLDLGSAQGAAEIFVDRRFRPFAAIERIKEKDSYERPIAITEMGLYPGFINRRVRWEVSALTSRPATGADFAAIHAAALPTLEAALARHKDQMKNPLAPDEAVLLIRAADIVRVDDGLALIDGAGAALSLRDGLLARYRTLNNLAQAAAGNQVAGLSAAGRLRQPASLLVRLYLGLDDEAIHGQPLALIAGDRHVRLGM